ncbi:MAG: sel1 repeat family protein, partial [Myxococcales bacterium]|nr:sel1 repeat family protein [Myxococcales bacterium]
RGWISELADAPGGKDMPLALSYFEKGCDLNHYEACWAAGDLYQLGAGAPKNLQKARALLEKGCNGKHQKACDVLATLPPAEANTFKKGNTGLGGVKK